MNGDQVRMAIVCDDRTAGGTIALLAEQCGYEVICGCQAAESDCSQLGVDLVLVETASGAPETELECRVQQLFGAAVPVVRLKRPTWTDYTNDAISWYLRGKQLAAEIEKTLDSPRSIRWPTSASRTGSVALCCPCSPITGTRRAGQ